MKMLLKYFIGLLFFINSLFAFEYSYLPSLPINYIKSYKFAFDFIGNINSNSTNNIDSSIGLSFRKIYNFQSSLSLKYYSDWNTGFKGDVYYSNYSSENFLQTDIGPTLGYNITNHLNLYISMGLKGLFNLDNNKNNNSDSSYAIGFYGEGGMEYFINDDFTCFISYQTCQLSKQVIGSDDKFKELRVGIKITYR